MGSSRQPASGPYAELEAEFEQLHPVEAWWRDRSDFLESHGYRLRPRFRPGWVPLWRGTGKNPLDFEDSRFHTIEYVMDATRLSDGRAVALKRIASDDDEFTIIRMLSSEDAMKDPMNHCVPILDCIGDWQTPSLIFIVMPLLHDFDEPEFATVGEVLDFMQQTLEGLVFLHRQRVAHRDLTGRNIMMDADALYPDGSHTDPSWRYLLPNQDRMAKTLTRSEVGKVKYYIIDFGISTYFRDPNEPHLVTGFDGIDQEVPELSLSEPYDPFAVDIFTLGNTYKKTFYKYKNMNFLSSLVEGMIDPDPTKRPTAEEALSFFEELKVDIGGAWLDHNLRPQNESIIVHYIHEMSAVWSSLSFALRQVLTPVNVLYVAIPVGASILILLRGHGQIHRRVCSLITHFLGSRR